MNFQVNWKLNFVSSLKNSNSLSLCDIWIFKFFEAYMVFCSVYGILWGPHAIPQYTIQRWILKFCSLKTEYIYNNTHRFYSKGTQKKRPILRRTTTLSIYHNYGENEIFDSYLCPSQRRSRRGTLHIALECFCKEREKKNVSLFV